jgi:ABC-type amino acid transport substrate-binding protein
MRRSLALRIGTLVLVVFTTTAPAFAAPNDDSPIGIVGRVIERVVKQVKRVLHPTPSDLIDANIPKP